MIYETHLTIKDDGKLPPHLPNTKVINLQLASGFYPTQKLVGGKKELSTAGAAINWAFDLERTLNELDYNILRVKLEAPLFQAAAAGLEMRYAEAHWKFEDTSLEKAVRLGKFLARKMSPNFLLSWSLDERHKAWLTTRYYGNILDAHTYMRGANVFVMDEFGIVPAHYEAVLIDTNSNLDAGWKP